MSCQPALNPIRISILLITVLLPGIAPGSMSLPEIRYKLHQNKQASVEDDLRTLAKRGDQDALLILAELLSRTASAAKVRESFSLYRQAFASGNGDIRALAPLARMINNKPALIREHQSFFQQALQQYSAGESLLSASSSLEIFLVYPDLFSDVEIEHLIKLYRRGCIEHCHTQVYRARLAQRQGKMDRADRYYRLAVRTDARAVNLYFRFLGDEQIEKFTLFSTTLKPDIDKLPLDVVQAVAAMLASVATDANPDILLWLDSAVARGSEAAKISKASYMMSTADDYSPEQVFNLIEEIQAGSPLDGRMLLASAYMVRSWPTLNPFKARDILIELLNEGHEAAYMGLGELYSMGGLDEADQMAAIAAYKKLAQLGNASAYYRIAHIYASGRSICHDKPKAYAYARMALDQGELQAAKLLKSLETEFDEQQLNAARNLRVAILNPQSPGY